MLVAELWGALMGLSLAWSKGITLFILEVDHKSVVELTKGGIDCHRYWNLISPINQLMTQQWKVEMCYTYQEGNRCADHLTGLAMERPLGDHNLESPQEV